MTRSAHDLLGRRRSRISQASPQGNAIVGEMRGSGHLGAEPRVGEMLAGRRQQVDAVLARDEARGR